MRRPRVFSRRLIRSVTSAWADAVGDGDAALPRAVTAGAGVVAVVAAPPQPVRTPSARTAAPSPAPNLGVPLVMRQALRTGTGTSRKRKSMAAGSGRPVPPGGRGRGVADDQLARQDARLRRAAGQQVEQKGHALRAQLLGGKPDGG